MTLAPVLTQCAACRHPLREQINGWIKENVGLVEISKRITAVDKKFYLSRQALARHKNAHLQTEFVRMAQAAIEDLEKQSKTIPAPSRQDLAILVRDQVRDQVARGELQPSIRDGLTAWKLIEDKADRGLDREIALRMAQALGGVIEGSYRDVTPSLEQIEDETEFALLTAG